MALLDFGGKMMLVYEHKTNGRKLVPNGLSILDNIELVKKEDLDIRMTTKAIVPGKTWIDLYKVDLIPDDEKQALANTSKGADVDAIDEDPWRGFFGHEWEGHSFNKLVILVPEEVFSGSESETESKWA